MPNGMDYSLLQRAIDGTGMILDTTPGSPDQGSYVTESQLADWIKGKILFTGYYYNGNFYSDSGHTTLLAKVNGALYIDQTNANKALYVCLSSTYQSLTEEAQVQAIIDGLNDGTIVPLKAKQDQNGNVIDQTYETKADASDLKSAIQANTARIENLEQEHGGYVTVNYRGTDAVPTGKAKYALVESIVGKSRAWYQLMQGGDFTSASYFALSYCSLSVQNHIGTITLNERVISARIRKLDNDIKLTEDHKVLLSIKVNPSKTTNCAFYVGGYWTENISVTANTWQTINIITTIGNSGYECGFGFDRSNDLAVNDTVQVKEWFVRDLSLIFPEGVPSTVAECVQECPDILKYDSYGSSIVDTTVEGVRARGVNWWNGQYEVGTIDNSTGQDSSSSNLYRSVGYTEVKGGLSYYWLSPSVNNNGGGAVYLYDENKNFIKMIDDCRNMKIDTTPETAYIRFKILTSYFSNEQIALDSCPVKTTYHAWVAPSTLTLPSSVTLRSAGTVADTDELNVEVNGVARRRQTTRIGSVDLANIGSYGGSPPDWTYYADNVFFVGINKASNEYVTDLSRVYSDYGIATFPDFDANAPDKSFSVQTNGNYINIKDSTCNGTVSTLKAKLVGLVMNIVKTTESVTLLDPIENNTIQTEGGGTINTIQNNVYPDESPAPTIDNSMDVGYLAL